MQLPASVRYAMNALVRAGRQVYVVGGSVRDALLGKEPHDYDLTTSALPEEMIQLFSRDRVLTNGLKHGTLTLLKYGTTVEITAFRIDGEYSDGRHPDFVEFTGNLYEDVMRRDFTINALCWNPETGLIDYVDGEEDLRKKVVRCVGDPDRRFQEDALRILRALRFSATLDFDVEPMTAESAIYHCENLSNVAVERVLVELRKLLSGERVEQVLLEFRPVMEAAIPEISDMSADEYMTAARRVALTPPSPELRMAALLYGLPEEKLAKCAARLKFSKASRRFIESVGACAGRPLPENRVEMRRALGEMGEESLAGLIELRMADARALCHLVIQQGDCVRTSQLAVTPEEVFQQGVSRRKIAQCLNELLDAVIEGRLPNEKQALLEEVRVWFSQNSNSARPAPKRKRKKTSSAKERETTDSQKT